MPVVYRLQDQFADQLDFVALNIDDPSTMGARERFDIVQRSQYVLTDASGNVITRWFGPLDETSVADALRGHLAGL
jgi:hypothetical protein